MRKASRAADRRVRRGWSVAATPLTAFALALAIGAAAGGPVRAAEVDVQVGEGIARRHCAACHTIGPTTVRQLPPAFHELAQSPATTEASLRFLLGHPHYAMPNLRLDADETVAIVAYILSLRERAR